MKYFSLVCATLALFAGVAPAGAESPVDYRQLAEEQMIGVNGRNVVFVRFPDGTFEQKAVNGWIETSNRNPGTAAFRFVEQNRDDWSVYLFDASRNVYIQLDLHRKEIMYNAGNEPRRPLYRIVGARTASVQSPQVLPPQQSAQPGRNEVLRLTRNALGVEQIEIKKNQIVLTGPTTNFIFSGVNDQRPADGNLTASAGIGVINGRPDIGRSFSLGARVPAIRANFVSGAVLEAQAVRPGAPQTGTVPNIQPQGGGQTPTVQGGGKPLGPFSLQNVYSAVYLGMDGVMAFNNPNPADPRASWLIEPIGQARPPQFVRIKSQNSGGYLHLTSAGLRVAPVGPNEPAGLWRMQKNGNAFSFQNAAQRGQYLSGATNRGPFLQPIVAGDPAPLWKLAATPSGNAAPSPAPAPTAQGSVSLVFQNYSNTPLDIFIEETPGDLGFVETIGFNQEIELPSRPGVLWRFAQNDQWTGTFTASGEARQVIPYGR